MEPATQYKKTALFRARLAEWSNALDLRSSLFGGAGSNPAGTTWIIIGKIVLIYSIYMI